jgi:hypothetical protein
MFWTLRELLLHHNFINGTLPGTFRLGVALAKFDVSFTNVSGRLPATFALLPYLQV